MEAASAALGPETPTSPKAPPAPGATALAAVDAGAIPRRYEGPSAWTGAEMRATRRLDRAAHSRRTARSSTPHGGPPRTFRSRRSGSPISLSPPSGQSSTRSATRSSTGAASCSCADSTSRGGRSSAPPAPGGESVRGSAGRCPRTRWGTCWGMSAISTTTREDPNVRTYQTTERQFYHSDSCDIVALMCLRPAKRGGLSSIVSSVTLYNEMARRRPGPRRRPLRTGAFRPPRRGPRQRGAVLPERRLQPPRGAGLELRLPALRRVVAAPSGRAAPDAAPRRGAGPPRRTCRGPRPPSRHGVPARRHPAPPQPHHLSRPHRVRGLAFA